MPTTSDLNPDTGDTVEILSDDDGECYEIPGPSTTQNESTYDVAPRKNMAGVHRPLHRMNPYLSNKCQTPPVVTVKQTKPVTKKRKTSLTRAPLQAGLVLEEEVNDYGIKASSIASFDSENETGRTLNMESFIQQQNELIARGESAQLFEDKAFPAVPSSIQGAKKKGKKITCRCKGSVPAKLDFKVKEDSTELEPFYKCAKHRCKFYRNAFQAERMHWYRFGEHTLHTIVCPSGFSASDLCQGRVGDCWFLSALAVVAERPDLILRLFGNGKFTQLNSHGICQVNLFLDGYWSTVIIDNFLPCLIDRSESQMQQAIQASLGGEGDRKRPAVPTGRGFEGKGQGQVLSTDQLSGMHQVCRSSSKYNLRALPDQCLQILRDTWEYLQQDAAKTRAYINGGMFQLTVQTDPIDRAATSEDLAYSKAKSNQLWVPLLEKAYAKSHGSYQAISGGHIAEAFLDLTGAPTVVYHFDSQDFNGRRFWGDLMRFRQQRLPMGCATAQSQVGIIGMHAYSILDIVEVKNVSYGFFQETGVAHGNVSGYTEFDGTVRLLQIRNPHGKSEWKGDFSDHSDVWEKLLRHQGGPNSSDASEGEVASLERTMQNDGKFWIDYDSFLMGFTNVDVVLAFLGNHAKSFASNFPQKKSNHRCSRAFEVSLLDAQPGLPSRDTIELYIMGIQKTRRGAGHGRSDRKVSYKVCDLGMLVGENHEECIALDTLDSSVYVEKEYATNDLIFTTVKGQMFGFKRNGHYRLILDRKKNKSLVVMPISFGHPAATDKELSFVLRFVSDAPLFIRELPSVPRMDKAIQKYCLSDQHALSSRQGIKTVLLEGPAFRLVQIDCLGGGGGTVFVYFCMDEHEQKKRKLQDTGISLSMQIRCRGMSCRTREGLLQHETIAKGKKFEAAERKYESSFSNETQSRLLTVFFQSGQDYQFGGITCKIEPLTTHPKKKASILEGFLNVDKSTEKYFELGIFNGVDGNDGFVMSKAIGSRAMRAPVNLDQGFDMQLEQALALSRGDVDIPEQVANICKANDSLRSEFFDVDSDLQRVLAISTKNGSASKIHSDGFMDSDIGRAIDASKEPTTSNKFASFDDDLERAIILSVQDSKPAALDKSQKPSQIQTVDLTGDDDGDGPIDLDDVNPLSLPSYDKDNEKILKEKRRLAAEAAIRRFSQK